MLRYETKFERVFRMKHKITYQYKSSAICYKSIADAIYKTLKEGESNGNSERGDVKKTA